MVKRVLNVVQKLCKTVWSVRSRAHSVLELPCTLSVACRYGRLALRERLFHLPGNAGLARTGVHGGKGLVAVAMEALVLPAAVLAWIGIV